MSKLPLVITHGDCFDGVTAAWAFKKLMGDAEFFYARYGDAPPDTAGRNVWILDFSYKRDVMKQLILKSNSTVVLDHHKSAEADLDNILDEIRIDHNINRGGGDKIVFDMERSGAGITWDYLTMLADVKRGFHKPSSRVWLIDYVEDRDLWRMKLPNSAEVSAVIASTKMTFDDWEELSKQSLDVVVSQGKGILRYINEYGDKACAQARVESVCGYEVPAVNLPYMNCSDHVNKLLGLNPDAKFAAGYFRRNDGKWQFSLRSREDFDVSTVAETFGGGGHHSAAGFLVEQLPWEGKKAKR